MKLTKWALLGVAGLALVFLPKRSSPKTSGNKPNSTLDKTLDTHDVKKTIDSDGDMTDNQKTDT